MSFSNGAESALLKLLFTAVNWANIADNTATAPATNLYLSLHNGDPGEAGTQATNETIYTSYARQPVLRSATGFTVSGTDPTQVQNAGVITFPQCGATGDTITHWGIGTLVSGAGVLIASGPIGAGPAYDFTGTLANPCSITAPGSALAVNARVSVYHNPAAVLPVGLTEGTVYYVGTAAGAVLTLSTTAANANPVNASAAGSGMLVVQAPLSVANLVTPSFAIGALTLLLD